MFKFEFDIDDGNDDDVGPARNPLDAGDPSDLVAHGSSTPPHAAETAHEGISLEDLLHALPECISYSPLVISSINAADPATVLARRDLFDARFQLLAQGAEETSETDALRFVNAPSDLVRGVYEGGLKTWECSVDLAAYLHACRGNFYSAHVRGRRVLEIGCGTAVPTLYLLSQLFADDGPLDAETKIHLLDYNRAVLELVTLPNIILAWYMSPASSGFRASQPSSITATDAPDAANGAAGTDADPLPPADPTTPGDLPLSPALHAAFLASLEQRRIDLRFFAGSWAQFPVPAAYDLVLSSETIYHAEGLRSLVQLMRAACRPRAGTSDAVAGDDKMLDELAREKLAIAEQRATACLVAAKVLYFGVGGGIADFVGVVERPGADEARGAGKVENVWEQSTGVGRRIMSVAWPRV